LTDRNKADSDPTKDPTFQKVVQTFLTTLPKRHEEMKVGKRKAKRAKSPASRKRKANEQTG
jgi:hypothetical protein